MLTEQSDQTPTREAESQLLHANIMIRSNRYPHHRHDGVTLDGSWVPGLVSIGNTGLHFLIINHAGKPSLNGASADSFLDYIWEQHFTPEGTKKASAQHAIKYSLIYAFALNQFLNWWENRENFYSTDFTDIFKGEPKANRPKYLTGSTNSTMEAFRLKLLGANNFNAYSSPSQFMQNHTYFLHLDRLAQDKEVRSRIEKLSDDCKKRNFAILGS